MIDFSDTLPMANRPKPARHPRKAQTAFSWLVTRRHEHWRVPEQRLELVMWLVAACWLALAVFAPALPQPEAYHRFADQRALAGLPFAMDVLSNGGFVAGGAWGLWRLGRTSWVALSGPVWVTSVLFFGGLLFTGVGSAAYHVQPDAAALMLDRMAMGVAFAGLLGLAVADRVSGRSALGMVIGVLLLAPVAAALAWRGGNATPWLVLQLGGLMLLLALTVVAPRGRLNGGTWGLPLLSVVLIYALAKVFELADHAVFDITHGWVSGHTLKHLVASCVVWPVLSGLSGATIPGRMQHALSLPNSPKSPRLPGDRGANLYNSSRQHTAQVRPS